MELHCEKTMLAVVAALEHLQLLLREQRACRGNGTGFPAKCDGLIAHTKTYFLIRVEIRCSDSRDPFRALVNAHSNFFYIHSLQI